MTDATLVQPLLQVTYVITTVPGMGRQIPFKVYPNGDQIPASVEEQAAYRVPLAATAERDEFTATVLDLAGKGKAEAARCK